MSNRFLAALGAVALAAAPLAAQQTPPTPAKPFTPAEEARYLDLGKRVSAWMLGGQADSVVAVMSAGVTAKSRKPPRAAKGNATPAVSSTSNCRVPAASIMAGMGNMLTSTRTWSEVTKPFCSAYK